MVSDKTRRDAFIEQNLGLVHACAGRFRGRGMEYDDLYSAGCMGLVKACDHFDENRGVCFSTYAVPVILGEIKKLFRDGGTVKVSRSLKELGMRVQAAREHHMKLCGTEPTLSQLAEELDEPVENITLAIQAAQPAMSLTPENTEDGDRQLDIPVDSPEEALSERIPKRVIIFSPYATGPSKNSIVRFVSFVLYFFVSRLRQSPCKSNSEKSRSIVNDSRATPNSTFSSSPV